MHTFRICLHVCIGTYTRIHRHFLAFPDAHTHASPADNTQDLSDFVKAAVQRVRNEVVKANTVATDEIVSIVCVCAFMYSYEMLDVCECLYG